MPLPRSERVPAGTGIGQVTQLPTGPDRVDYAWRSRRYPKAAAIIERSLAEHGIKPGRQYRGPGKFAGKLASDHAGRD